MYPNPAADQVAISMTNATPGTVINIYDIVGNLAYSTTYGGTQPITIPTAGNLSPGIYTVSVGNSLNTVTQKLVVR